MFSRLAYTGTMQTAEKSLRRVAVLAGMTVWACLSTACAPKPITIEARFDPKVLDEWAVLLAEAVPGAKVSFVSGQQPEPADILMEGDRASFTAQQQQGAFLCSPGKVAPPTVDPAWVDPDGCFAAFRVSLRVIAYHTQAVPPRELPERWKELNTPRWEGKVGTNVQELEKGSFPLATVFLEEVLRAQKRGAPLRALYPLEGLRAEGWPVAIRTQPQNPEELHTTRKNKIIL